MATLDRWSYYAGIYSTGSSRTTESGHNREVVALIMQVATSTGSTVMPSVLPFPNCQSAASQRHSPHGASISGTDGSLSRQTLALPIDHWTQVSQDQWVLGAIQGYIGALPTSTAVSVSSLPGRGGVNDGRDKGQQNLCYLVIIYCRNCVHR